MHPVLRHPGRSFALSAVFFGSACASDQEVAPPPAAGSVVVAEVPNTTATDSFAIGLTRIGAELAPAATGKTVAVLQFPNFQNQATDLGTMVAERLTTALVQNLRGRGRVIERSQVLQVLGELDLLQQEITTETATRAGRQLGADVVVLGTASVLDGNAIVSARAVQVQDGSVTAAGEFVTGAEPEIARIAQTSKPLPPPTKQNPVEALLEMPSIATAQVGPIQVQAHACARTGQEVICILTMYSPDIDVDIGNGQNMRATDNMGNTLAVTFEVGRERPTHNHGALVAGVTTPLQVTVPGVPLNATSIARLHIPIHVYPQGQGPRFNLPLLVRELPIVQL